VPAEPRETVVVIGNGMAGHRFCQLLCERAADRFHITIFAEEPVPAYDRIHLSAMLGPAGFDQLLLAPRSWYRDRDIELHLGDPVVEIDRAARLVRSQSGQRTGYQILVFATGAAPVLPPIAGIDLPGVLCYRTAADLDRLRQLLDQRRRVAVLGGGLIGLEAALAAAALGAEVHVIERSDHLLPRQLDGEAAVPLQDRLVTRGLQLHLATEIRQITRDGSMLLLERSGAAALACDIAIVASGVRPRDELATACGLRVASSGGIVVNDASRSSDDAIYAIGDCASHRGIAHGLLAPAHEMASVAVDRLLGGSARLRRHLPTFRTQLAGLDVVVFGQHDAADLDCAVFQRAGVHRALYLDQHKRMVGARIVGGWSQQWDVEAAVRAGRSLDELARRRFCRSGDLWPLARLPTVQQWPADRIVCECNAVSRGTLARVLDAGQCTVAELSARTGAGTTCGSCMPLLAELCGQPPSPGRIAQPLLAVSAVVLTLCVVYLGHGPLYFGDSIRGPYHALAFLWRDELYRKISGFSLVACSALLGGLLSLRKRARWWRRSSFARMRLLHAGLAATTLLLLAFHTAMSTGHNLNRLLLSTFLGVNCTGAIVGIGAAIEARGSGRAAMAARRLRPVLKWSHYLLLWVLPVFLGFHVWSVYYF
jgi:nitrite reductase (NADH) large subunit